MHVAIRSLSRRKSAVQGMVDWASRFDQNDMGSEVIDEAVEDEHNFR